MEKRKNEKKVQPREPEEEKKRFEDPKPNTTFEESKRSNAKKFDEIS